LVNREGVEACRLESDKGIAVVLLNWTDEPIDDLTVEVPGVKAFRKVTSIEQGEVRGAVAEGTMRLALPLKHVDILLIE
jgi:hypothetical protein